MGFFFSGWSECQWSVELSKCISPSYVPLKCLGGICGNLLRGPKDQCPISCEDHNTCQTCLQQSKCGWCAFDSTSVSGEGSCLKGTIEGPENR